MILKMVVARLVLLVFWYGCYGNIHKLICKVSLLAFATRVFVIILAALAQVTSHVDNIQ